MPLARLKVWSSGEVLTASDLNGEINNILNNPGTLVSPMAGPLLHADGTIGAPGISFAAEPSTGFSRPSTTVMTAIVNGANNMQWQPGHTFCFGQFNLNNSQAINFYNAAGNALWEVLHANAANTVHIGRIGWSATTIYGGGVGNLTVTAAGVNLSGTITGISGSTIGLPNVANHRQVYELRNGASAIYIGWNGRLEAQVDATYFGGLWPIDIDGTARRLYNPQTGGAMTFNWSGQGGQPSWLWGSNDGANTYVYNPSNFSVNYANSAGSAGYANNSGQVSGVGGWSYGNWSNNPTYLWATEGDSQTQHLTRPEHLNVSYANSTNYANSAGSANTANYATNAAHADHASYADSAGSGGGGTDGLRAKDNIADSVTNASAAIDAVRIIEFDDKLENRHFSTGFLPANLETIDSGLVYRTVFPGDPRDGPKDTLNVNPITILAYAIKALQELSARVKALEART